MEKEVDAMAGIGIDTSVTGAAGYNSANDKKSSIDKDAFLKLLVTQMQYQDPLEPTSNTEYMSQMAQFSSVEQIQNLSSVMSSGQSMNLTGQYVILNVPDAAGNISQVSGLVDYVTMTDGKAYFHIGDEYYLSDYLDSVVSLDYIEHMANKLKEENPESQTDKTTSETTEVTSD
jgi:flagellar basal-body rod modification protein FlgD